MLDTDSETTSSKLTIWIYNDDKSMMLFEYEKKQIQNGKSMKRTNVKQTSNFPMNSDSTLFKSNPHEMG